MSEKIPLDRDRVAFEINRMRKSETPDLLSREEEELEENFVEKNKKVEKNPEQKKQILEDADADEILFRQALERRMKWNGLGGKIEDFFESKAGKVGNTVLKFGGSAIASRILATGLKRSLGIANPITGAIVGGITGGFWGYIKARRQNESIVSWEKRVDILDKSEEDLAIMDDEKLELALGILNQAVKDGKVSGKSIQKIELARKIRTIKNSLEERHAAVEDDNQKNPVMKMIDDKIKDAEDTGKAISEMTVEKYQNIYKEIIANDRKKAILSGVKGTLIGAGVGALANWAMDKLHIFGGGGSGHQNSDISALKGQETELARKHLENMNLLSGPSSEHLTNLAVHGGNVNGFSGPDMSHFTEMVKNGSSMKDLHQFAEMRNIDFGAANGHGQAVGQFIMEHKDQFLNLSPDVQREILSYPSLSNEIFDVAISNSAVAGEALTTAIVGGAGLAAIGGGFLLADREQKYIDKKNNKIISESKAAAADEMKDWRNPEHNQPPQNPPTNMQPTPPTSATAGENPLAPESEQKNKIKLNEKDIEKSFKKGAEWILGEGDSPTQKISVDGIEPGGTETGRIPTELILRKNKTYKIVKTFDEPGLGDTEIIIADADDRTGKSYIIKASTLFKNLRPKWIANFSFSERGYIKIQYSEWLNNKFPEIEPKVKLAEIKPTEVNFPKKDFVPAGNEPINEPAEEINPAGDVIPEGIFDDSQVRPEENSELGKTNNLSLEYEGRPITIEVGQTWKDKVKGSLSKKIVEIKEYKDQYTIVFEWPFGNKISETRSYIDWVEFFARKATQIK